MQPIFITGIGTGVGKTIASAVVTEALQADYWKPVQAGFEEGTDALTIKNLLSNQTSVIYPESYKLQLPASPHIAAGEENIRIDLNHIVSCQPSSDTRHLIVEGAGGILVPLNENEFVIDLIEKLQARVILVSRNYLGSINHSLLTAAICKQRKLDVIGWLFNDQYLNYENEIVNWSGYTKIGSISFSKAVNALFIKNEADKIKNELIKLL
jgi:dethiobiotin synthetase